MKGRLAYVVRYFDRYVMTLHDLLLDLRVCGRSLVKQVPSIDEDFAKGIGSTRTQSTPYAVLRRMFDEVAFTCEDVFIDVGCGKGRVLAYLVKEKVPCELYGVEFNPAPGEIAQAWSGRYDNVHVIVGDAFDLDYDRFTIMYMSRPFLPVTFMEFIELLESQLNHPITLVYWVDQQSGYLLRGRAGWTMLYREILYKVHGLRVANSPQGYSVWRYEPQG